MNETTKAVLRREIEQKQRFVDNVSLGGRRRPVAACHAVTAQQFREEIAQIRASLIAADTGDLSRVDGVAVAPALDLTQGEVVHIHNA